MASPPELVKILRISPIAMGEEGLRPSTPQAFVKACAKLLSLSAGDLVLFRENPVRDVPGAGVKKAGENFTFHRGRLGSFFRTTSERDLPHRRW